MIFQATMVWAPHATTTSQWTANKVLQGFFGAPIESLCGVSVADVVCPMEKNHCIILTAWNN